mgnify:CR=1 FL=1
MDNIKIIVSHPGNNILFKPQQQWKELVFSNIMLHQFTIKGEALRH